MSLKAENTNSSAKSTSTLSSGSAINILNRITADDLSEMINIMPQIIWTARPDGYRDFFNNQWFEFTNTTYDEVKGDKWLSFVHPEDRKRASEVWEKTVKSKQSYKIEYRLKNGLTNEWKWMLGQAVPIRNSEGKLVQWVGTVTNIDEQIRYSQNMKFLSEASKILSSSIDYQTTLQNIAQIAVPEIADWCSIEMKTENGLRQLALSHKDPKKIKWAKELAKKYPSDPNAPTGVPQVLRTCKAEMLPVVPDELLVASVKNKEQLDIMRKIGFSSVMIVPIIVAKEAIGAISFVTAESLKHYTEYDLAMAEELASRASVAIQNAKLFQSSQREIERRQKVEAELMSAKETLEQRVIDRTKELRNLNTELERSNRELEDFAYVASHDLQEPLRKIQAFGNLLKEEYAEKLGEGNLYVDRMEHAAFRMRTLIEDLLSFSRVTTRALPMKDVNLSTIVEDILIDMEVRIKDSHAVITTGKLPKVTADPLQMRQLFQNLISNALKFHKKNVPPKIDISAKRIKDPESGKSFHQIQVSDNGIGFDEKYTDRIFTVFQRLHGKEDYEGTGVGLAVVRKIVERHNGRITAKSTIGKGATFIIELPDKEDTPSSNPRQGEKGGEGNNG